MGYADAKARLVVHAQTAGNALTPKLLDVQQGLPLPKDRSVRVYYGGETDAGRMGGRYTLNSEMVGKVTLISAFWALTNLDSVQAAIIDAEAEAFSDALRTAVDGDTSLNGEIDNTTLDYGEPDIVISGNTRYLMILWRAVTDYTEYAIAK